MADQITVIIDGRECSCEKGEYVFDVARRNGIEIPGYCRSDAFPEHRASCRMCMVELEQRGRTKLVASCVYPIDGECSINTKSERVEEDRAVLRALIKAEMPEEQAREFERVLQIENDKCILCGLCMQACESLGTGAISLVNRGVEKDIDTPYGKENLACMGCLSCANVCPTMAITYEETETTRTIWHREFQLAKCERCGAVVGTTQSVMMARAKMGLPIGDPYLCAECTKEQQAQAFRQSYRVN